MAAQVTNFIALVRKTGRRFLATAVIKRQGVSIEMVGFMIVRGQRPAHLTIVVVRQVGDLPRIGAAEPQKHSRRSVAAERVLTLATLRSANLSVGTL